MRIDTHSHILPPSYLELFKQSRLSTHTESNGGQWTIRYGDIQEYRVRETSYDPVAKLQIMDRLGIDVAVLSTNIPGPELLPPELALRGAQVINDYLAELIASHPGRFAGLASIPWEDTQASLTEIERAHDELGLCGVVLYSNIAGKPVDDPTFEPIYRALAERGAPIVFHPTVPSWGSAINDYSMIPMLGLQVDTSFALLRLILGGVLERHPSLHVVMPHAGGILPYIIGRVDHQTETLGRGRENISRPPSSYLKDVYIDTVTPSAQTLKFAYEFSGADRLLFGTDDPWVDAGLLVKRVDELQLPPDEAKRVYGANAQALFNI